MQNSVNFVSLLENGKTGLSIQTIIDLCKSLSVDTNAIFEGVVTPTNIKEDSFILNALNMFDNNDKTIVTNLITYIINSKN